MDLLTQVIKWLLSMGITPLELLTIAALAIIWRQHKEERKEWKAFMESMMTRYETLLNENIHSLAIIDAKLDKQE